MSRELWLAERRKGVCGSDSAAVMGLDPHRTEYEVYLDKTGQLVGERAVTERMLAGSLIEGAIANLFAKRFNVALRKKPTAVVHPRFDFVRGNLDRTIVGQRALLECKNVDHFVFKYSEDWGPDDSDQVPLPYLCQVHHYMLATGYDVAYFAVLVGGNELHRFIVRRDAEFHELLLERYAQFWHHVEKRIPPPINFAHPSALSLMKRRYPGSDGKTIDLPDEALEWHRQVVEGRELEARAKAMQDEGKAHLLDMMQGASVGRMQGAGEYRYSQIHREGYEVAATDYVTLRHCKTPTKPKKQREVA